MTNEELQEQKQEQNKKFVKRLASDYKFWGQYRIILSLKNPVEEKTEEVLSLAEKILLAIQQIISEISKKIGGWFRGGAYNESFEDWQRSKKGRLTN